MVSYILRLCITSIFALTTIPKILGIGKSPTEQEIFDAKHKITSWVELETSMSIYTWFHIFKYPEWLLTTVSAIILFSLLFMNYFPPPHWLGSLACINLLTVLGGGIYSWAFSYRSMRHTLPAFASAFQILILLKLSGDSIMGLSFEVVTPMAIAFGFISGIIVRIVYPIDRHIPISKKEYLIDTYYALRVNIN